jgi:hypothetical protein
MTEKAVWEHEAVPKSGRCDGRRCERGSLSETSGIVSTVATPRVGSVPDQPTIHSLFLALPSLALRVPYPQAHTSGATSTINPFNVEGGNSSGSV